MYEQVLDLLLACGEVDAVAVNFTPPLVSRKTDDVAAAIAAAVDRAGESAGTAGGYVARPVVASLLGADESGQAVLRSARHPVPSITYPETAVRALAHALRYGEWRARPAGTVPVLENVDTNEDTHGFGTADPARRNSSFGPAEVDLFGARQASARLVGIDVL